MAASSIAHHRIFLIGMPGSGKSYWGVRLAGLYNRQFIDLDEYICEREGRTVEELFVEQGELGFRILENRYLAELMNVTKKEVVIACGGGTPCFADNMRLMKIEGVVIYLEANTEYLHSNISADNSIRPLFNSATPLSAQIEALLQQRKAYYEQAHFILQAKDISLTTFGEILGNA